MTSQMPEEKDVTRAWEKAKAETQERQAPEDDAKTKRWESGKEPVQPDDG
jgi:hypothetical protein